MNLSHRLTWLFAPPRDQGHAVAKGTLRTARLSILVISNEPVLRRGVAGYLGVIGLARTVVDAPYDENLAALVTEAAWDLVVLDFEDGGDLASLRWLEQAHPKLPVLVLGADNTSTNSTVVVSRGASGYLHKGSAAEEWRRAFETVASGGRYPNR